MWCTYAEADSTHDPHTPQLLPVLLWNDVLVDQIEIHGGPVIVPLERQIQNGHLIRGREDDLIIYLELGPDIDAHQGFL